MAQLPLVRHVSESSYEVNPFPAGKHGLPLFPKALLNGTVTYSASLGSEYFSEDQVALVAGRLANPKRATEFMADTYAAKAMGWHVGEYIQTYLYSDAQANEPGFGSKPIKPKLNLRMHLVGHHRAE